MVGCNFDRYIISIDGTLNPTVQKIINDTDARPSNFHLTHLKSINACHKIKSVLKNPVHNKVLLIANWQLMRN